MVPTYASDSIDKSILKGKTFSVIGFGNQGRSQALNLRDSGCRVLVGNIEDGYMKQARDEGFTVLSIRDAVQSGDIILVLIPDEIQPIVFEKHISGALRTGQVLDFASGYNIHFGLIHPPNNVDVIMVAPKMIGAAVRTRFNKLSIPNLIAVNQNSSGHAKEYALALSAMIGGSKGVSFDSSFRDEAELDLFSEHAIDGPSLLGLVSAFDVLVQAGFSPELIVLELYQSGEIVEVWKSAIEKGLLHQLEGHSTTSQYGQLTRGRSAASEQVKQEYRRLLTAIHDGSFVREWTQEMQGNYARLTELKKEAYRHPINDTEKQLRAILDR
jgi:ketol-acid reductoisomerase